MAFDPDQYLAQETQAPQKQGAFDPDEYLKSETAASVSAANSVKPKAPQTSVGSSLAAGAQQGLTLGYAPQLEAGVIEPAMAKLYDFINGTNFSKELDPYIDRRDKVIARHKKAKEDNPGTYLAGNLGGGIVSGLATAPLAGARAATVGGRIGKAALAGGVIGGVSNPGDIEGEYSGVQGRDRAGNALLGGIIGAGVQGGGEAAGKAITSSKQGLKKIGEALDEYIPRKKVNADAIEKAAKNIGSEATPGMIYEPGKFPDLEDSLSQSPTLFGQWVRKNQVKLGEAQQKALEDVGGDASNLTNFEAGDKVVSGINKKFAERAAPVSKVFEDIRQSTKNIPVNKAGVDRTVKNIKNIDGVRLSEGAGGVSKKANQYTTMLNNAKSADDLKTIATMVSDDADSAIGGEKLILEKIKEKVRRLEQNNITRSAIAEARTKGEGAAIGKQLIGDLKQARKDWSGIKGDIRETSKIAKVGNIDSQSGLANSLDRLSPEQVVKKFFNTGDKRLLTHMRDKFPNEFDVLRRRKVADIVDTARDVNGKLNVNTFLRNANKLDDNTKEMVFGSKKKLNTFEDLELLWGNRPPKVGPSGTPHGEEMKNTFSPRTWANDAIRYAGYKYLPSKNAQNFANKLKGTNVVEGATEKARRSIVPLVRTGDSLKGPFFTENPMYSNPKLKDLISQNPELIDNIQDERMKKKMESMIDRKPDSVKGKEAWAIKGFSQALDADTDGFLSDPEIVAQLMNSKRGRELLIKASSAKPGSKQMQKIVEEIKSLEDGK
jgi:hypothetical protein